jgi:hypothetical protein
METEKMGGVMEHDWVTNDRRRMPQRCVDHENRMGEIEKRQIEIYKSMFGHNGNPKDGYAWKIERVYEWFQDIMRIKWIILPICIAGSFAAIWQAFVLIVKRGII